MEIPKSNNEEKSSSNSLMAKWEKIKTDAVHIGEITKQVAKDDPRKMVHSIKVGLAISLVSLFYYFDPLYQGFGVNAMWAVLTVVVVFEYSVGATLGKGVNRVLATIFGGMCGVGAHRLASLSGEKLEPVLIGLSVFLVASVTTFMRFYPKVKAKFDYGMLIFILTFSLISVSGYRDDEVIDMGHRRITTILIGSSTAVVVCVLIWPVWAGTDLHKLVASNLEKLAHFVQEFGVEYFKIASDATSKDNNNVSLYGVRSVLDSKSNIDSLVNFAKWEPRHGRFKYRYPWTQYQKIGELTRLCACRAEALHGYLHSDIQAPKEVKSKFQETCIKMSSESGKAMKELSQAISKMRQPSKAKPHIEKAKQAAEEVNQMLRSSIWKNVNLSDVTPTATVASLLADVVVCIEDIEEAVQELASLAKFKNIGDGNCKVAPEIERCNKMTNQGSIKRRSFNNHVILIEGSSPCLSQDPPSLSMSYQVGE